MPAGVLLVLGLAALAMPQFLPADTERVAVFAPTGKALAAVAAAGGTAFGGAGNAVYAVSAEPGFVGRLYQSGAWLVLRFDGVAGCTGTLREKDDHARG